METIEKWSWKIFGKKIVRRLISVGVAYGAMLLQEKVGVGVDIPQVQEAVFLVVWSLCELIRNKIQNREK